MHIQTIVFKSYKIAYGVKKQSNEIELGLRLPTCRLAKSIDHTHETFRNTPSNMGHTCWLNMFSISDSIFQFKNGNIVVFCFL